MRITFLGVLGTLGIAGCADNATELRWTVEFANAELQARSARIKAELREGGCNGSVVYEDPDVTEEAIGMGETVRNGRYGFAATANDPYCLKFATACVENDLPMNSIALVLVAAQDEERDCPGYVCHDGACTDVVCDCNRDLSGDGLPIYSAQGSNDLIIVTSCVGLAVDEPCPDAPLEQCECALADMDCNGRVDYCDGRRAEVAFSSSDCAEKCGECVGESAIRCCASADECGACTGPDGCTETDQALCDALGARTFNAGARCPE